MHMRTHMLGNESHGNSSVGGGGDNPVKGEAAKELTLNDTGLGWGTFPSTYNWSGAFWRWQGPAGD